MSDNEPQKSSWEDLVQELGLEVGQEAFERHQPTPQELPSRAVRADASLPEVQEGNWDELASSLGIEPAPVPERPQVQPAAPVPQSAKRDKPKLSAKEKPEELAEPTDFAEDEEIEFVEVIETEEVAEGGEDELEATDQDSDEDKPHGISGDAARSAFDALFSPEAESWGSAIVSPRTNVESSFLFTEGEEAVFAEDIRDETDEDEEDSDLEEEPKPKRRRRGGRGRGRGRVKERAAEEVGDQELEESTEIDDEESVEDSTESSASDATDEPIRRRRRRRRSKGRPRGEATDAESKNGVASSSSEDADDEGEDDDDSDEDSPVSRASHRNLPTWDEAISVIVESNMTHREKNPAKQQQGPRGRGRGRRRGKR